MAKGVCNYIVRPRNVFDVKIIWSQLLDPLLFSHIQLGIRKNVGQWVVVRPHRELLTPEPVTKFLSDCPFTFSHLADAFIQSDLQLGST